MKEGTRRSVVWAWWGILSCIVLLHSCAGTKQSVTRELSEDEHSFSSSANPRVTLTLPTEWESFGKVEEAEYDAGIGTMVEARSYFWGRSDERNMQEGFLVRELRIPNTEKLRWNELIFAGTTKKLDSGTVEIEDESYEYLSTIFPNPLTEYEERLITNAGYEIPHFFLVHALGQLDSSQKMKIYFLYFQHLDLSKFNGLLKEFVSDDWDEEELSEDEQQMLKEFFEDFQQNIHFSPFKKADA